MTSPTTNTYNSPTDLSLGHIPQVDDPVLYEELLNIHNAIEITLTATELDLAEVLAYIAKQRSFSEPPITGNYTILITDGTVRVDATAGNITVTAHPIAEGVGFRYNIKRIDEITTNKVTIVGDGTELIDARASGINLSTKSSYTIKSNDIGWDII